MVAMGPLEIVMLLALGSGGASGDLATLINPQDYFKSRRIEMSIDKLAELAGEDPVDGKTQLGQLLALRVLGEQAKEVKKSPRFAEHKKLIEAIAAGKKARDRLGFAPEYAAWTLAQLTGDARPRDTNLKNSVREEALQWFPANVSLVAAMDFRPQAASPQPPAAVRAVIEGTLKTMSLREREEFYTAAETIGNARIERQSAAFAQDPNTGKGHFFLRFTGKADHERLATLLRKTGLNVQEQKGPQGERISTLPSKGDGPGACLIGDSDFVLTTSIDEVLAVRAGKQPSVLAGPLADELKKVSAKAVGLVVGAVPEEAAKSLTRPGQPFRSIPRTVLVEMLPQAAGYEVRFHGKLDNADDAKSFSEAVKDLQAKGLEHLKDVPKDLPTPLPLAQIRKSMESLRIDAKGDAVTGGVHLSREAVIALPLLLFSRAELKEEKPSR